MANDPAGSKVLRQALATFLLLQTVLAAIVAIQCWSPATSAAKTPQTFKLLWVFQWTPAQDTLFILLVIVAGVLGAAVHALTSLSTYYGNGTFATRWVWWYIIRLPVGATVALTFYFVLRAGFLPGNANQQIINPYAMTAMAALSGMFSKQATDKLNEIFQTLFRTESGSDSERRNKVIAQAARPDKVEPSAVPVGTDQLDVKITGTGFTSNTKVRVGSFSRTAKISSPTELQATLKPEDVAAPGMRTVLLLSTDPAGQERMAGIDVRVCPRIDSLQREGEVLTIVGAGFDDEATVTIGGTERVLLDDRSDNEVAVALAADDEAERDRREVIVHNPAPAGGESTAAPLGAATGWAA